MRDFIFVECGFYFVEFEGKLQQVRLSSVWLLPDDGTILYFAYVGTRTYDVVLPKGTKFYDTERDFFRGVETTCYSFMDSKSVARDINCNVSENGNFKGWILSNTLKEIEFKVERVEIEEKKCSYEFVDINGYIVESKIYKTRQDLLDNSIVNVVDDLGNEKEVVGYKLKLQLNPEQQQLVKQFQESVRKLRESGVELVVDYDNGNTYAFNAKEFDDIVVDFGFESDPDDYLYEHVIRMPELPEIDYRVRYCLNESCYIGVNILRD